MTVQLPEGKCYLTTYVDHKTIEQIDKLRGEVPRNIVVRRALKQFLERETGKREALGERKGKK
jgi:hypothetical protein